MRTLSLLLLSLVLFGAPIALAGDNAGVHEHDELLVRVSLGGGFTAGWAPGADHALAPGCQQSAEHQRRLCRG